jgi:hypothetical protein
MPSSGLGIFQLPFYRWRIMASHAYVDESSRGGYLLCAVVLLPAEVGTTRRFRRGLCKPGQRRVHMKHESDGRRKEILSAVAQLGVEARSYRAQLGGRSERRTRDDCLRAMIPELLQELTVTRMVVESCDQDHQDNQVIREWSPRLRPRIGSSTCTPHPRPSPCFGCPTLSRGPTVVEAIGYGEPATSSLRYATWDHRTRGTRNPGDRPSGRLPGSLLRATALSSSKRTHS